MREFFSDLQKALTCVAPTFLQVPTPVPFPHLTIEPKSSLHGVPGGPALLNFNLKVWSRYAGTREVLKMMKAVEKVILSYPKGSLKILKSSLMILTDGRTRVHVFILKARVPYE